MAPKDAHEMEDCKKQGNDCVKEGKFIEAMLHYTRAIKMDPKNHLLYSNRSLTFLKMDQYYHALEDAQTTIKLNPKWPKGFYRKGEVEFKTEHYSDAVVSYRNAMILDPEDKTLQEAVSKAQREARKQYKNDQRIPWYGLVIGALFGLLIVVGDSALAEKPVLTHWVLQCLLCVGLAAMGYGLALAYRYFMRSQRDSLLAPPLELFPDESPSEQSQSEQDSKPAETANHRRTGNASAGKHRMRKGKTS